MMLQQFCLPALEGDNGGEDRDPEYNCGQQAEEGDRQIARVIPLLLPLLDKNKMVKGAKINVKIQQLRFC